MRKKPGANTRSNRYMKGGKVMKAGGTTCGKKAGGMAKKMKAGGGTKIRGTGCATKGLKAMGPMG